jgi:hypothetical protein
VRLEGEPGAVSSADRPEADLPGARAAVLRARLRAVEDRVQAAASGAGRHRDELTLVVVTKTFPASDVRLLWDLGVRDVGENRDREAAAKASECAGLALRWHFVGQVQTNKARSVARYADWVHSVDRVRLADALGSAAGRHDRQLTALVQVDLDPDGDPGRGGARPGEVPAVADAIAASPALRLGGVMAVAPLGADAARAFDTLADVAARLRADHPDARVVSAGMSGDLEQAVAAGATHLRVGSAVLGSRPALG